jgi:DnaD/phage-associated family protein
MPFCSFSKDSAMFDSTPIENMFLLEYLPTAPEGFLRVYLYARMLCLHPELGGEIGDVARALHMDEDSVYNAFHYWEQMGLVEKLSDRPASYAIRPLRTGAACAVQLDQDYYKYREYNSSLQDLFGREELLEPRHYKLANDWLNVLGFTQDAALRMLEYEKQQSGGKKASSVFRRADKRAVEWAERGILSLEDVQKAIEYDDSVNSMARAVLSQLGIGRKPSVNELDIVRRWVHEWKLSQQDVLDACVYTTKSRNPSIAYLDAILKDRASGGNPHFSSMKAILQELGASNTAPTPEQIRKYTALLEQGFEAETLMLAAVQCAAKDWHTLEKLEWMLQEWGEAGVYTRAQAENYLSNMQRMRDDLRALYKNAGIARNVYANDLKLYGEWKQNFSPEMILCAAQCAVNAREPVKYMNKLLIEWQKAGISTAEAARAQHMNYQAAGNKPAAQHMNYQQRPDTDQTYGKDSYSDPTRILE